MLRDIIKKEILVHLLDFKFLFAFIVCAVLILLSVHMGVGNYATDKKEYEAGVAAVRRNLEGTASDAPSYDFISPFTTGVVRVHHPPQALGAIVRGVEDASGRISNPSNLSENRPDESKYESNPLSSIFGTFDQLFVVKMILSLFAMLFAYDAVSGEKEKGTLRLALANSVPRDRLLLGKAIGGYISLLLPLLVPLLLSMIFLSLNEDMVLSGNDWTRLALIYGMFLLYLSVFFALGLFVSALTSRSVTSFLALLFVWIVFVMIIPKTAAAAAERIHPVPFMHEIIAQKTLLIQPLWIEINNKQSSALRGQLDEENQLKVLQEYGQEFSARIADASAKIDNDYRVRQEAQQHLAKNLSRISPASGLTFGSMILAQTGAEEYHRFLDATRTYRTVFRNWLIQNNLLQELGTRISSSDPNPSIDDMPQFQFEPESLGQSLARTLPDFALMVGMTLVLFVGACIAFLRYDVR